MLFMPALRFTFLTTTLLAAPLVSAQTTYRWIDPATGRTVISDRQPPQGAKQIFKTEGEERRAQQIPYATRQAAEKFPVILYTSAECIEECKQARDLLNGRGVPFTEKMLKTREEAAELTRKLGSDAIVPSFSVGQENYKGFQSAAWSNLLDLAGYPKTAPYGAKQSGAFAK